MIMMPHSVNNNTCMGLVIFLCSNSNHLVSLIPRTDSNFRHSLSCRHFVAMTMKNEGRESDVTVCPTEAITKYQVS